MKKRKYEKTIEAIVEKDMEKIVPIPFDVVFQGIEEELADGIRSDGEPDIALPKPKRRRLSKMKWVSSIAASLVIVISGIIIGLHFGLRASEDELHYSDDHIIIESCEEADLAQSGLYIPQLAMLSSKNIYKAKHKTNNTIVFYRVQCLYDDGISFREIDFMIILVEAFQTPADVKYLNLPYSFKVADKTITYSASIFDELFYRYYVSLNIAKVRYQFIYKTIEPDDVQAFFSEFCS